MKQSETSTLIQKINTKLGFVKIKGAYYKNYETFLFFENLRAKGMKNKSFWAL